MIHDVSAVHDLSMLLIPSIEDCDCVISYCRLI